MQHFTEEQEGEHMGVLDLKLVIRETFQKLNIKIKISLSFIVLFKCIVFYICVVHLLLK